jgi:DNA-binding transcriptional LysR family regulator
MDLRLSDLRTFMAVVRLGSINGAARGLHVSPSQVSKAIERLERRLNLELLTRGRRGVSVSAAGQHAIRRFEAIFAELAALDGEGKSGSHQFTIVATAFLNAAFIPTIVSAVPRLRVRSVELPPGVASAYAAERLFDAALTNGTEKWPKSWNRVPIGELRRALFAAPPMAQRLGRKPLRPESLSGVPFIAPVYSYHGQVVPGEDGCPIPASERQSGHQTQTVALALDLAQLGEQVVFAPEIAARPYVASGRLVELPVVGWDVRDSLFIVCDAERVMASDLRDIVAALRGQLQQTLAPVRAALGAGASGAA